MGKRLVITISILYAMPTCGFEQNNRNQQITITIKSMNEIDVTNELFLKLTEVENQTNFDEKIKAFMGLKLYFGEFSLDVYFDDISIVTQYTARLSFGLFGNASLVYHSKKRDTIEALDDALHALVDLFFSNYKVPSGWEFRPSDELRMKEYQIRRYRELKRTKQNI